MTALLFIVGLVALYIEMSSPGIGMGILTAGLCFALFFWSRFLGGTADWLELVLFLAGMAFLSVELFVLPGFGVAGLTGMLLLGASLILASQDFVIPHTNAEMATLARSLSVLMGSMLAFFVLAAFMSRYFGSLPVLGMLMLKPPDGWRGSRRACCVTEQTPVRRRRGPGRFGTSPCRTGTIRPSHARRDDRRRFHRTRHPGPHHQHQRPADLR